MQNVPFKIDFSKLSVYLCGPIDNAEDGDGGKGWREKIVPKLLSLGFKEENIYNPCDKPINSKGLGNEGEFGICENFRLNKDWDGLIAYTKNFMSYDLRLVDKADIVIAKINAGERTVGSIQEIVVARNAHKPVYLIDKFSPHGTSSWLMALIGTVDRIFRNDDDLIYELNIFKNVGISKSKDLKDYLILYGN